jgi:hypothetical protein
MQTDNVHRLVHQASRRELGDIAVAEDLLESTLVVVKALDGLVVHAAHVDNDVARVKNGGVARPLETCRVRSKVVHTGESINERTSTAVCRRETEHVDRKRLVRMERPVVRPNDLNPCQRCCEFAAGRRHTLDVLAFLLAGSTPATEAAALVTEAAAFEIASMLTFRVERIEVGRRTDDRRADGRR